MILVVVVGAAVFIIMLTAIAVVALWEPELGKAYLKIWIWAMVVSAVFYYGGIGDSRIPAFFLTFIMGFGYVVHGIWAVVTDIPKDAPPDTTLEGEIVEEQ